MHRSLVLVTWPDVALRVSIIERFHYMWFLFKVVVQLHYIHYCNKFSHNVLLTQPGKLLQLQEILTTIRLKCKPHYMYMQLECIPKNAVLILINDHSTKCSSTTIQLGKKIDSLAAYMYLCNLQTKIHQCFFLAYIHNPGYPLPNYQTVSCHYFQVHT